MGRISGFYRDWLIAYAGGASYETDIALVLISLPDLMVTFLIGGGFSAAVVPLLREFNQPKAMRLHLQLQFVFTGFFVFLSIIMIFNAEYFLFLLLPGLTEDYIVLAKPLFMLVIIAIPIAAASAITQAHLISQEKFWYSASGTLVFNSVIMLSIFFFIHKNFLVTIVLGIIVGVFSRLILQLYGLRKQLSVFPDRGKLYPSAKLVKSIVITTSFAATFVIIPIIVRAYASFVEEGGLSLFSYAYRIIEVPIVLLYGSLATIILPFISNLIIKRKKREVEKNIKKIIRLSFIGGVAVLIPSLFFSDEIILILFSTTRISNEQIEVISLLFFIGVVFLPFRGLLLISLSILPAINKTKNLLIASIVALLVVFSSIGFLQELFGIYGAMLSYGSSIVVATFVVIFTYVKEYGMKIIKEVFVKPVLTIFFPILLSVVICAMYKMFYSSIIGVFIISFMSVSIFILTTFIFDDDGQLIFQRLRSKIFSSRLV